MTRHALATTDQISLGLDDGAAGVVTTNDHGSLGVLINLWCGSFQSTLAPLVLWFANDRKCHACVRRTGKVALTLLSASPDDNLLPRAVIITPRPLPRSNHTHTSNNAQGKTRGSPSSSP